MSYLNCGAYVSGQRPASKKALREALSADASTVRFDVTAMIGPHAGETFQATQIPAGDTMQVTGPDPYSSRKWYASVTSKNGKITVR